MSSNASSRPSAAELLAGARDLRATADVIDAWIRAATPREIVALAALARSSFRANVWSEPTALDRPIPPARFDAFDARQRVSIAALLSTHRSGFVRQIALDELAASNEPLVVPFFLLRTDDIVPSLRATAEAALEARLAPAFAAVLAQSLDLVARLGERARGGKSRLGRSIHDFLRRFPNVLRDAWNETDPRVRQAAFKLSIGSCAITDLLLRALDDGDMRVRLWAARTAISRATNADEKRALLPHLEASRSAWTRTLALRARAQLDAGDAPLDVALLDHDARVRYVARTLLRARRPERSLGATREAALAVLADEGASRDAIVGALGALSDVGVATDVPRVAVFLRDARAAVRREAERTNAHLTR